MEKETAVALLARLMDIALAAQAVLDADIQQCDGLLRVTDPKEQIAARNKYGAKPWRVFQSDEMRALEAALSHLPESFRYPVK